MYVGDAWTLGHPPQRCLAEATAVFFLFQTGDFAAERVSASTCPDAALDRAAGRFPLSPSPTAGRDPETLVLCL